MVTGRVVSLSADIGDRVQAGQQVGQLDPVLKGRLHESRFLKPFKPLVRALGLARKES